MDQRILVLPAGLSTFFCELAPLTFPEPRGALQWRGVLHEDLFDLGIATVAPGAAAPADAHVARVLEPTRREIESRSAEGWFYKPCYVTYVIRVPGSLDEYIQESFRAGTR